jgi:hypothetical protein
MAKKIPEDLSEKEKAEYMLTHKAQVTTDLLTWLGVHGNLCLALRHPGNRGPGRRLIIAFVKNLGKTLVNFGVITESQLKAAEKLEIEEGSSDLF